MILIDGLLQFVNKFTVKWFDYVAKVPFPSKVKALIDDFKVVLLGN